MKLGAAARVTFPSTIITWNIGCSEFVQVEDGLVDDFSAAFYFAQPVLGGSFPANNKHVTLRASGSFYNRQNNPVTQAGVTAMAAIFETSAVGTSGNLFDSPSATIVGAPDYVLMNGVGISLADYNANGSAVVDGAGSIFAR